MILSQWPLPITYNNKTYNLRAVLEWKEENSMRIQVHGNRSSIVLDVRIKDGVYHWEKTAGILKDEKLLKDICDGLEVILRGL